MCEQERRSAGFREIVVIHLVFAGVDEKRLSYVRHGCRARMAASRSSESRSIITTHCRSVACGGDASTAETTV